MKKIISVMLAIVVYYIAGYRAGNTGLFYAAAPDDCPAPESRRGKEE